MVRSMKIRTLEALDDVLTRDYAWRLKELATLLLEVKGARPHLQPMLLRAALPLLYAHWEGFIKVAANSYLEYVGRKGMPICDLSDPFAALALRRELNELEASTKSASRVRFMSFVRTRLHEPARLPYRKGVETRANLKAGVLRDIVETLGLDYSPFELKEKLIDRQLVDSRNSIAHG